MYAYIYVMCVNICIFVKLKQTASHSLSHTNIHTHIPNRKHTLTPPPPLHTHGRWDHNTTNAKSSTHAARRHLYKL